MKNKKRGVALLSAIMLMSVVLAFTLLISTFVVGSNLTARYQNSKIKTQIEILEIKNDFVDDGMASSEKYDVQVKNSTENQNIKLMIVSSQNKLQYICVYNFDLSKMIASQSHNFALKTITIEGQEYYSIAGLNFSK